MKTNKHSERLSTLRVGSVWQVHTTGRVVTIIAVDGDKLTVAETRRGGRIYTASAAKWFEPTTHRSHRAERHREVDVEIGLNGRRGAPGPIAWAMQRMLQLEAGRLAAEAEVEVMRRLYKTTVFRRGESRVPS